MTELLAKQARVTLNTYARPPLMFTRGKGLKIWDTQNREYLDLSAGIAVNALGHADEGVAKEISAQVRLPRFGSSPPYATVAAEALAKICAKLQHRLKSWCTARTSTTTNGPVAWPWLSLKAPCSEEA